MKRLANQFVINETFKKTDAFYRKIESVYKKSNYHRKYPLTHLWGIQNMKDLLEIINENSDPIKKIASIHNTFMFSVNTAKSEIKNLMINWYLDYFDEAGIDLTSFSKDIQESAFSNSKDCVVRRGRRLSPDFLRTLIFCLEIAKYCHFPRKRLTFLELGAGYGGLARTFKLLHPNSCCVIIDIPQSLYFSSLFLRLNFPKANFCYVTGRESLKDSFEEYDFVFLPPVFADILKGKNFDIFCNTASLGEMKNSVIRYWMDFVQNQINLKYFFGVNRFLNTLINPRYRNFKHFTHRLDENQCSVAFDPNWKILQWELEPKFSRCPYVETQVTRNLEILAERLPHKIMRKQQLDTSRKLIEKVARQDWFIYFDADNTTTLRDNILAPDLTKKGTLFLLWESIRLMPNPVNIQIMLQYLSKLVREDKPFEETFFYQNLLRLVTKDNNNQTHWNQLGEKINLLAKSSRDRRIHFQLKRFSRKKLPPPGSFS